MPMLWKIGFGVLVTAIALYFCVVVLLWWNQRSLVYPAPAPRELGMAANAAGIEAIEITTDDGLVLRALYRPGRPDRRTIVFFHGNGDSLTGSMQATRLLAGDGYGLLLPEYRGYGGNPGAPSERGLYRDGSAALRWLASQGVAPERTILIGNSLGSGVATELAATNRVGGLVLVSGFISLVDAVQGQVPFVPVRWLLHDRFENRRKIAQVTCPILILHGTNDILIPAYHATSLAQERPDATLQLFPGVGHELVYTDEAQIRTSAWLRRFDPQPTE